MLHRGESSAIERMTPVLVGIQAGLEADLSLATLARKAGLSPFHFHREFSSTIGETPKAYALRLRLERAAYRLIVFRGTILDVALDCGFASHETFTRAFRRHFHLTPREYRARGQASAGTSASREAGLEERSSAFRLSETRVREMDELHVAFVRHVGPYENVPISLWETLRRFAGARGWPAPSLLIGIGHDAPSITPPERLRFDAAILAPGPFRPEGRVGFQTVPAGWYGLTTHVGPHATLPHAYRTAFERLRGRRGFDLVGLPCVELYRTTRVDQLAAAINETDLCIRLEPR